MNSPAPDTLKLVKEFPRSAITFGVARLPGTGRVFLGGSDFAVAEADRPSRAGGAPEQPAVERVRLLIPGFSVK